MSELFYIDTSLKTQEKFDIAKFMRYENDDYDPLTSYLLNRLSELPTVAIVKVFGQENLPDLLSSDYYDTENFWELLLIYNQLLGFDDLKNDQMVRLFNPSDLEDTYLSLSARQKALKVANSGITTTNTVNNNSISIGDPLIVISSTAPTNKNAVWKKPNNNNLFVFDTTRNKWLSISTNELLVSVGFNNVSNQYLFSSSGQNTNLIPLIMPKNLCICQSICQSENQSSYNIFIQDFTSSASLQQINISNEVNQINNNLNLSVNEGQELKIFLNGLNISNPKITLFYREIG
jgi:hypothetical protein